MIKMYAIVNKESGEILMNGSMPFIYDDIGCARFGIQYIGKDIHSQYEVRPIMFSFEVLPNDTQK